MRQIRRDLAVSAAAAMAFTVMGYYAFDQFVRQLTPEVSFMLQADAR